MIQDGYTGVLTGGKSDLAATNKVTRYNRAGNQASFPSFPGKQEQLPLLITARYKHGCSSLDIGGKKVRIAHGIG